MRVGRPGRCERFHPGGPLAENAPEPLPTQAMPAKKRPGGRRGLVVALAFGAGLCAFLILDDKSFVHGMIFNGQPFSWDAVLFSLYAYGHFLFFAYLALSAVALFLENRNPDRTVAWLLVLALLPVAGFILYWIVGPNFRYRADKKRFRLPRPSMPLPCAPAREQAPLVRDTFQLIYRSSGARLVQADAVTVFHDGAEAFSRIMETIANARRSVLVESFIIENDAFGNRFKDALMERARAGVTVCVIYDAVGCWRLGARYVRQLRGAGVLAMPFLPVSFPMFRGANYRNHRKIMVIDGEMGFTGGLNIGDAYVNRSSKYSYWRDTHMEISGQAANELREIFLNDLAACGVSAEGMRTVRQRSEPEEARPADPEDSCLDERAFMQIVASGPDTPWDTVEKAYLSVFSRAREKLWITTPYLVPGNALMEALCVASLSGVDVRLLLPGKGDHTLVHWATMNCLDELLRAGVRIFLYDKTGFVHAKTLVCDGAVVSVGTANLDARSLEINFEVQAFIYNRELAVAEEAAFEADARRSVEITFRDWRGRPKLEKVKESVGKVFSSLL